MVAGSDRFLKPFMKEMSQAKTTTQYSDVNKSWVEKMEESLTNKKHFVSLWSVKENEGVLGELFEHQRK